MNLVFAAAAMTAVLMEPVAADQAEKPTILLVHGAFADASSWNRVIEILERDRFRVVAVANPLRGVHSDAQYVNDIAKGVGSLVVLVGHSYGGSVISEVSAPNAIALVYVAAFAPEIGETAAGLSGKFPGSTLGSALAQPIALASGGKDLYIQQARFHEQFAADVSPREAGAMAAGQRPVTEAALNEGASRAAWKSVPSWHIYGDQDKNIPPQAMAFMAQRAKSRLTEVVHGASHVVMVSNPEAVASMIERAATSAAVSLQVSNQK